MMISYCVRFPPPPPPMRLSSPPLLSSVYSFDGILVFGLFFICTCAYLKKVPRINSWLLSEKKGVWGVFYKGRQRSRSHRSWAILVQSNFFRNLLETGVNFVCCYKCYCYKQFAIKL